MASRNHSWRKQRFHLRSNAWWGLKDVWIYLREQTTIRLSGFDTWQWNFSMSLKPSECYAFSDIMWNKRRRCDSYNVELTKKFTSSSENSEAKPITNADWIRQVWVWYTSHAQFPDYANWYSDGISLSSNRYRIWTSINPPLDSSLYQKGQNII